MKNNSSQLLDINETLQNGWALFKCTYTKLLPFTFVAAVVLFLPLCWPTQDTRSALLSLSPWFGILSATWLLAFLILCAALYHLYHLKEKIPCQTGFCIRHVCSQFFSLLILISLYGLIVMSATMMLIIPGILLAISLMFAFMIHLTTGQNVSHCLFESHQLVWGNWWRTLLTVSLVLLNDLILVFLISALIIALGSQFNLATPILYKLVAGGTILLQTLLLPWVLSTMLCLFDNLNKIKNLNRITWPSY